MAELFNRDNLPNRHAVDELLARPELGPAFEQKYGPGTARYFLGIGEGEPLPGTPPAPTDVNPLDLFDGPAFNGGRDDDQSEMVRQRFTGIEELRSLDWMAEHAAVIPAEGGGGGSLLDELRAQMQAPSIGAPQPAPSASAPVAGKTQYGFTGPELAGQMDTYLQDASKGFPEGHQISEDDVIADFFQAVESGLIPKADVMNLLQDYRQTEQGGEIWRDGEWRGMPFTRAPVKQPR